MRGRQGGFTLIEVMVVLVVSSMIGAMLIRWQWQQQRAIQTLDDRLIQQERRATTLAHLRRDLSRSDTFLPALSDVHAGPDVLIAARRLRDPHGYAGKDTAYVVYQLQRGLVRRSVLGSDAPVLAQPIGRVSVSDQFRFLDATGDPVEPARSREARSVSVGGTTIRLGGEAQP